MMILVLNRLLMFQTIHTNTIPYNEDLIMIGSPEVEVIFYSKTSKNLE